MHRSLFDPLFENVISFVDSAQENHAILQEACSYKFEVRRDAIAPSKEDVVEEDDVTVTLLADLQQIQEKQAEEMLEEITDKARNNSPVPIHCKQLILGWSNIEIRKIRLLVI